MRSLSPGMATMLAGSSHTLTTMLRLDLVDGSYLAFTDHSEDLLFDLGDGMLLQYVAGVGIIPSDVELPIGLEAGSFEVSGPFGQSITRAHIFGRRLNNARARLFLVDWADLASGFIPLAAGRVGTPKPESGKFSFEVRTDAALLEQVVGDVTTPQCRTYYGSPLCGKVPESTGAVVTAVTDEMHFNVSFTGDYPDDFFNAGTVEMLTGEMAGTGPQDIHDWTAAGAMILFEGLVGAPAIGDECILKRGCPRARSDCMERQNILNFRGEPDMPGSDRVLRATIPGKANV